MGDIDSRQLGFLGPIRVHNANGISIRSAVCAQFTAEGTYTLQWLAPLLSKLSIPMGNWTPSNTCLGPPESISQTPTRSVQLDLHGSRSWQTDRQTDRQTTLLRL